MDSKADVSNNTLIHCHVIHAIRRRVRIEAPTLRKDEERAYILEILLRKRDGIKLVRTVADIGTVVVHFDPRKLPRNSLLMLLDALIGNLGLGADPLAPHPPNQLRSLPARAVVQSCH